MHLSKSLRRGALAAALLFAALSSTALTLGRSRGVALIGRPLEFTIAVTLDSPADEAGLCAEADVFQGDTRVSPNRVAVRLEPGPGRDAVLRVRSDAVVDEPVVTVYLRLGCTQKITRRYVLLAEQPGDILSSAPVETSQQAASVPLPARPPALAAAPAAAPVVPAAPRSRPSRSERAAAARTASASPPEPVLAQAKALEPRVRAAEPKARSAAQRGKAEAPGRSRLKVDLLDLTLPEADARLKSATELPGPPTATPQQRADAAALWRALRAEPADVLRDAQRMQAMESDIKGLRDLVKDTSRSLDAVKTDLEQARSERSIAIAAAAIIAVLLVAALVAWRLMRRGSRPGPYRDWWRRQESFAGDGGLDDSAPHRPRTTGASALDVDLGIDESMFEDLKQPARPFDPPAGRQEARDSMRSEPPSFQHSMPSGLRMVKAEELVDIQQQAEFFVSLGQVDQAIEVLKSHIHNNVETSALVWLDLLDIYRTQGRQGEYNALRSNFQTVFNAQVPDFDAPPGESKGLEGYPRALSRIVALWPSPKVLEIIEESIFRKPGMADGEPFDLQAYRELVMLYNVGKEEIMGSGASAQDASAALPDDWMNSQPGPGFQSTNMHPLMGAMDFGPSGPVAPEIQMPRASPRLGLDIDLTAEPAAPAGVSSNLVDFDLFEPAADTGGGDDTIAPVSRKD
ncbi:MAG: hypothetical protein HYX47_14975 [Burkholderiales bacterium]|nr:hypothetical protein [Burkholderiales bacterium]